MVSVHSRRRGAAVAPIENRNLNKARAGYDRTHVFVTSATYELPVGKGTAFPESQQ